MSVSRPSTCSPADEVIRPMRRRSRRERAAVRPPSLAQQPTAVDRSGASADCLILRDSGTRVGGARQRHPGGGALLATGEESQVAELTHMVANVKA
jgi:hypothetical protein